MIKIIPNIKICVLLIEEAQSPPESMNKMQMKSETEFKEFERRLKFKPPLKYGWFRLKLYSMF